MKVKIIFPVVLFWCAIIISRIFVVSDFQLAENESPESEGNPNARLDFEIMRLKDPTTGKLPENIRAKEIAFAQTLPKSEVLNSIFRNSTGNGQIQSVDWKRRGPYNIGGRTRALAVDIDDDNTMLAGCVSGGMWRTTNGGTSWLKTTAPTELQAVSCIAQDTRTNKTNIWYYGSGEYRGNSTSGMGSGSDYTGDGIYKSLDGGNSWQKLTATSSNLPQTLNNIFDYVNNIAVDISNSTQDVVYAAGYGGIARSTDGGNSWKNVLGDFSTSAAYTDVSVTSTGIVYASLNSGSKKGLWRSANGIDWVKISPSGYSTSGLSVIAIAPSNEKVVYFFGDPNLFWKYTFVSGDGTGTGGTWENRSSNLPASGSLQTYSSYCMVAKVNPNDENVVFVGGMNLYRSNTAFAASNSYVTIGGWNYETQYNHHADQHAFAFLSNPSIVVSGHDGGVSITQNCMAASVSWKALSRGYYTSLFYAIAIDHATANNNIIIGGMQDNGTWLTNADSSTIFWKEIGGGDGAYCAIADKRTAYYVSSQGGSITRVDVNTNGDKVATSKITPSGSSGFMFIHPFILDPSDTKKMYLPAGSTIWRNDDLTGIPSGQSSQPSINWNKLTNVSAENVSALGMSSAAPNVLYFGTNGGSFYRLDSADKNTSKPKNITSSNFPSGAFINCVSVDPANGNNVIVVFSNYNVQSLFYSSDGGTSFTAIGGNLEEETNGSGSGPSCRWAGWLHVGATTHYFIGTSAGLYSTTSLDGMSTVWSQEGTATIGNAVIDMVETRQSDGLVVVGTHGSGVLSTHFTEINGVNEANSASRNENFVLSRIFPNPADSKVNFSFTLQKTMLVEIEIFDVNGMKIERISSKQYQSGEYSPEYNTGKLSNGTYLCRFTADGQYYLQKLIVRR